MVTNTQVMEEYPAVKHLKAHDGMFYADNEPFRLLSGAMHYFRVMPEYWRDRMEKLVLMGLNTLETYVAWNRHEPKPGSFEFDGMVDIEKYVSLAGDLGLNVIVRPGPYICSEWELGGLPSWLLKDPAMRLRCSHLPYIEAVDRFFVELLRRLVPLQASSGGPIIAIQVENEYGSYGNDADYLHHLEELIRKQGYDGLLFTSDGPTDEMLQYGTLPGVLKTANFGSDPEGGFRKLRQYEPDGPPVCMEFWNGWFDHWGEQHHRRDPEEVAAELESLLQKGGSVNFYMFHGGTNFGFMNGANFGGAYQPTVTSYDDDAPINEHGEITPKFHAFRRVIGRFVDLPAYEPPPPVETMSIERFELTDSVSLFSALDTLSAPVERPTPVPMESLDQDYGFILYETSVSGPRERTRLTIREVHDRAHVFVDGQLKGILDRESGQSSIDLEIPAEGASIRILVENQGRINYGSLLADRKGITDAVLLGRQMLFGFTIHPLPLDDISDLDFANSVTDRLPAFFRGQFNVDDLADTFFDPAGWTKGVCWINGFNIGRYWNRGPQQTLYVPAPLLVSGRNEIVLLELDEAHPSHSVEFRSNPILDSAGPIGS